MAGEAWAAEWQSFLAALPQTTVSRDFHHEKIADDTFKQCVSNKFKEEVLDQRHNIIIPDAADALVKFAVAVGVSPDHQDVTKFVALIQGTKTLKELAVTLHHIYSYESFFYKALNQCLRQDTAVPLKAVAPLISRMMEVPKILPHPFFSGKKTLYRGLLLDHDEQPFYVPGLVFLWAAFTSLSSDQKVADAFASEAGTIFIVLAEFPVARETMVDMRSVSTYGEAEQEVLMSPYVAMQVTNVAKGSKGENRITCEALSPAKQITGVWDCAEDGGVYFITSVGSRVAWFGHSRPDSSFSWAHVFFGTLAEGQLHGEFGDICINKDRFHGELRCDIDFERIPMAMTRMNEQTAFMGRTWSRRKVNVEDQDRPHLTYCRSAEDGAVAGCWRSNTDETFYISCYGDKVFWFAHADTWASAHVAMGSVCAPDVWEVQYQDIVLSKRFCYAGIIRVSVTSGRTLQIDAIHGPFAATILERIS